MRLSHSATTAALAACLIGTMLAAPPDAAAAAPPWESITTVAPTPTYKVVAASGLKLRTGPGTKYREIGVVRNGTIVKSAGRAAPGWLKIRTPAGHTGWVASRYLVKVSAPTPGPPAKRGFAAYRVTARPKLVLRSGPGSSYKSVTTLRTGVTVAGTARPTGGWTRLHLTDGRSGWASQRYLTATNLPIYRVRERAANLRSGPGIRYRRLGSLGAGITAPGTGETRRGWIRIHLSDGSTAWIAGGLVTRSHRFGPAHPRHAED